MSPEPTFSNCSASFPPLAGGDCSFSDLSLQGIQLAAQIKEYSQSRSLQINLKNVPAQEQWLLPGCPKVIYRPSPGLWPHSDTQEAFGVAGYDLLRGAACPRCSSLLCHCGTTDTSCSCLSFQKYNLLLAFYCWLLNSQASLHLTLQKKFS